MQLTIGRIYLGHDGTLRRLRARSGALVQWCEAEAYRGPYAVTPGHTMARKAFEAWARCEA